MLKQLNDTLNLASRLSAIALLCAAVGCSDSSPPAPGDAGGDSAMDLSADGKTSDSASDQLADSPGPKPDLGDGGVVVPPCIEARTSGAELAGDVSDPSGNASVTVSGQGCEKTYSLTSSAQLKDNLPTNPRSVAEQSAQPTVRSNNRMFDALYALALEEVRENSVATISDGAFNNGQGVPCPAGGCFETGRKWKYVWTRDTAYAVALGLAALDPTRAKNSLEFKTSELRGGGGRQLVQDTGTGGSYPISSDRVVWAMGAWELLKYLHGAERATFVDLAYDALRNTVEHDRKVVYDVFHGLYRGEQSFLDWREQTYPAWIKGDPVHIGMSKALSTNVGHLRALEVAAALAKEKGDAASETKFTGWAGALRVAIRKQLWMSDSKLFSTFIPTGLDQGPAHQFDLLGNAFAVLHDVADAQQAKDVVAAYPHLQHGPPVIWPQQKDLRIYHNRGIWPFVTAFWLRAAKKVGNDEAVDLNVRSLMRAAALNLSNMENLEMVHGTPYHADGAYSGPVVNSQRQLWSVAAYVSMVHDIIFGIEAEPQGLRVAPFITAKARHEMFGAADTVVLNNYPYRGKKLSIVITLPAKSAAMPVGVYAIKSLKLNGVALAKDALLEASKLEERNLVEVELDASVTPGGGITLVSNTSDYKKLFAPKPPTVDSITLSGGKLRLSLGINGETASEVAMNIYRDGLPVAQGLPGGTTSWTDPASSTLSPSYCYVVETYYVGSKNHSQHSAPNCYWGLSGLRVTTLEAGTFTATGGNASSNHGRFHYENWGDKGHKLVVDSFPAKNDGAHLLQVVAGNGGPVDTGITCAVKHIKVEDLNGGAVVGEGYLLMPHLGNWDQWRESNFVRANLIKGRSYKITIESTTDALNMSSFAHFQAYTGGIGGSGGTFNRVNITQLKVLALDN